MSSIAGKTALITGGASGIGLGMAKAMLKRGAAEVVLWDINQEGLDREIAGLRESGFKARGARVDVTDPAAMKVAAEQLQADGVAVDVLINNAGIIVGKDFVDHGVDDIARTMAINAEAPMQLTRLVLPDMLKRGSGHVVNIASAAGLVGNPKMSVYSASKFALTGWSESLRLEMQRSKTGVQVLTVAPFYIDTGMFTGARSPIIPILDPDKTVERIMRAIERGKVHLRMPWIVAWVPLFKGVLPTRLFDWLIGDFFGMHKSMDHFKGREED